MDAGQVTLGLFGLLFVFLAVAFIRKSRRRRAELFAETPLRVRAAQDEALPSPPEAPHDAPAHDDVVSDEIDDEARADLDDDRDDDQPGAPPLALDPQLQAGLAKTHDSFMGRLGKLFTRGPSIDPTLWRELEDALLGADVGARVSMRWLAELRSSAQSGTLRDGAAVREALKARMLDAVLSAGAARDPLDQSSRKPRVILFVGVNGVGKTTTIGKLAGLFKAQGHDVLLAAGDTFRAAATEQLEIWGERTGCRVIKGVAGKDPASVVFNAITHAKQTGCDLVLCDSAGRLHTKTELMDEIVKVKRAAAKARDGAPDEIWLVVDATTGQNAVRQAEEFNQALGLSGVILTKLDGTAKGGVVVAIAEGLKLPVLFVGVGEQTADLRRFDPRTFIEALFAPAA